MAYDQYTAALRLNSKDAWTYDGRARVWRDWGFAGLGLSDAYHAVYLAPTSPVPQNTLGTLFLKIGLVDEARAAFARALALDPNASYALENLCRLAAAKDGAVDRCPRGR
jgi:tetratricopeptide (TPR) repeat protein